MLTVNNNLKDEQKGQQNNIVLNVKDIKNSISYTKTNKLITALYMVTDMLEKDEPIRIKLRTLGIGILSDIYVLSSNSSLKIQELLSFLEISFSMNFISEMNFNILKKEFLLLNEAIKDYIYNSQTQNKQMDLEELFKEELPNKFSVSFIKPDPIGHKFSTRIGVQKGSTLLKALSEKTSFLSDNNFILIKKNRREDIIKTIKLLGENTTIKDIKNKISEVTKGSVNYSEKTLQRELVSMIKDNVLYKNGEKRWSKYFIKD